MPFRTPPAAAPLPAPAVFHLCRSISQCHDEPWGHPACAEPSNPQPKNNVDAPFILRTGRQLELSEVVDFSLRAHTCSPDRNRKRPERYPGICFNLSGHVTIGAAPAACPALTSPSHS